ncbi:MAG: hypothetical protein JNK29_04830 [Anaerolineales bacterium]|nr:hypothetical protein [Anaerolineales bacterium]
MKRSQWLGLAVVVMAFLAWSSWMGLVNTRTTRLEIGVAGQLDEVAIYKTTQPDTPVAVVRPNGQDAAEVLQLRNAEAYSFLVQSPPAQYYFVARKGAETYRSEVICCETGFKLAQPVIRLGISDLNEWVQTPAPLP